MRYSVYKYIKNLSDSIVEATGYIKTKPENVNLLSDCIVAIITIKDTLVQYGSIEIKELDVFLETVNKLVDLLDKGKDYIGELDILDNLSKRINNICTNDIKYKFKIVFFAELGSKWDSMDSVYWAYKNREDCDVTVVLAPIYRAIKLPNGEVRSDVIYRDYLTDMGIKHILFKDYDVKKDMPDLVFTSQPYESVTPEQFWAENIAPYTRLVYLPYFTSGGIREDEQKLVQCQMPIHKLAWRVICQSENVKAIYSKYSEVNGSNIIACGLPKWDWVVNMNKRQINLPKDWEKLKGKKVVLRNVHYNIQNPSDFIDGIRTAMKKFENTDIAYLYRFHPMMETMFKVYYLDMEKEWEKIKLEIDNSSNFVIDRNETYDCAFKYSDVLLTEQTSLISQYLLTEKPVIIMYWEDYDNKCKKLDESKEVFVKNSKLYTANNAEEAYRIRDRLFNGDDYEYDSRMKFVEETLPNADGCIGERLSKRLIEDILKEDNIIKC